MPSAILTPEELEAVKFAQNFEYKLGELGTVLNFRILAHTIQRLSAEVERLRSLDLIPRAEVLAALREAEGLERVGTVDGGGALAEVARKVNGLEKGETNDL